MYKHPAARIHNALTWNAGIRNAHSQIGDWLADARRRLAGNTILLGESDLDMISEYVTQIRDDAQHAVDELAALPTIGNGGAHFLADNFDSIVDAVVEKLHDAGYRIHGSSGELDPAGDDTEMAVDAVADLLEADWRKARARDDALHRISEASNALVSVTTQLIGTGGRERELAAQLAEARHELEEAEHQLTALANITTRA